MLTLGVITGSGSDSLGPRSVRRGQPTPWGAVEVACWARDGWEVRAVARHGSGHERLSSQVEHRANVWALAQSDAVAIVGTTAVGVLDPAVPLGRPILFDDLFFPSNRLPDGSLATFFTEPGDRRRGHWIPGQPFSPALRAALAAAARREGIEVAEGGCYVHADGPRFNTAAEHRWMRAAGGTAVSQTCGPEAVLAGELGVPYALVGFGVNYTSGVGAPADDGNLRELLARHRGVVGRLIEALPAALGEREPPLDTGSVFRFET